MYTPAITEHLPNGLTIVVIDRPGTHQVLINLMVGWARALSLRTGSG